MIKTLSNYSLTIPWQSPLTSAVATDIVLRVYIWSGESSAVPVDATYTINKKNVFASTGSTKVSISRLIDDYISFSVVESSIVEFKDSPNHVWVRTTVEYITANATDDDVEQSGTTVLATKGYGYGNEGANPDVPSTGILIDGTEFRCDSRSVFYLPIVSDQVLTVTAVSYPDNNINFSGNLAVETDSDSRVKILNIPMSLAGTDTYVNVTIDDVTITIFIVEEYKYDLYSLIFMNKHGVQQIIDFAKEQRESLSVSKETYPTYSEQPADGYHQIKDFNINGKTRISLTTGYMPDSMNEAFKQLILSGSVYLYVDRELTPVNVVKQGLDFKTRFNDKLVSYDFEVEYSFTEINTI